MGSLIYQKMTPEEKAREIINRMLNEAVWEIVDRENYSPGVSAVAIKEGILRGALEVDYRLFLNGKAVGVIEAKREEQGHAAEYYVRKDSRPRKESVQSHL